MLERLIHVARETENDGEISAKGGWVDIDRHGAEAIVRAILTELREPSEAMLKAMNDFYSEQAPEDYYRAGVDAILEGKA